MEFYLNKIGIEENDISLSFKKINSFDKLLDCNLSEIIYIEDNEDEISITNQIIRKKKTLLSKAIYFQLNNSVFEPTKIYRDDFHNCGYIFYKMILKLKSKGEVEE